MTFPRLLLAMAIGSALLTLGVAASGQPIPLSEADRLGIALEALNRVESDPTTNSVLREALARVLEQVRGKPEFVSLVKKFNLQGYGSALLDFARVNPAHEAGVEAIRMVLAAGDSAALTSALKGGDAGGIAKLIEVLGNSKDKRAVPLILAVIEDTHRDLLTRKMAVRSLVQTQEGAAELLKLAMEGNLPADLRLSASEHLHAVRWTNIQAAAEKILPLPKAKNAGLMPSISALSKMKGNAANGEKIYFNETVACAGCHQVRGQGKEIGPNLSEIGTKLAREALFEAILDPNAGISFGFEAHQVELKSGNEAYGLLASETSNEIAIKDLQGIVTKYKKEEIAARKQLSTSIMPSGLAENLSAQEFVDLVEFLANLKKR